MAAEGDSTARAEGDPARCDGKERVITADADILAGLNFRAALAHDDSARLRERTRRRALRRDIVHSNRLGFSLNRQP